MNAMRLEKGYRAWGADFTTERTPAETGAGFLINMDHDFVGKDALAKRMEADDRWEMVLLDIENGEVDPYYAHGVIRNERVVGIVGSAAYGHRTGKTLALAYLLDRTRVTGWRLKFLAAAAARKSCLGFLRSRQMPE